MKCSVSSFHASLSSPNMPIWIYLRISVCPWRVLFLSLLWEHQYYFSLDPKWTFKGSLTILPTDWALVVPQRYLRAGTGRCTPAAIGLSIYGTSFPRENKQTNKLRSIYRVETCIQLQVLPGDKLKVSQSKQKDRRAHRYTYLNIIFSCDFSFLPAPDLACSEKN